MQTFPESLSDIAFLHGLACVGTGHQSHLPLCVLIEAFILSSLVSQRFQSAAPRDHLVEHAVDILLLRLSRFEYREIFEICEQRKPDLRADCGNLQFRP